MAYRLCPDCSRSYDLNSNREHVCPPPVSDVQRAHRQEREVIYRDAERALTLRLTEIDRRYIADADRDHHGDVAYAQFNRVIDRLNAAHPNLPKYARR